MQTSSTQTETTEIEDVAGSSAAEATAQVPPEILTDPTSKLRSLLLECWALSSSDEVVQRAAREAAGMLAPGNRFVEVWIENVSVFHSMCLDLHALGVEVHMEELMAPTLASALQIMAAADSALASWADGALPAGQWQQMLQPIFWANIMRFNMFAPLSHRMRWVSLNCEYGVKRKQGGLHYYTHPRLRQVRFCVPFPVAIAWKQHFSASHVNERQIERHWQCLIPTSLPIQAPYEALATVVPADANALGDRIAAQAATKPFMQMSFRVASELVPSGLCSAERLDPIDLYCQLPLETVVLGEESRIEAARMICNHGVDFGMLDLTPWSEAAREESAQRAEAT